jgi:vesicle-fusing ATPase
MELSLAGDRVPVQSLTFTPPYLESVDVEVSLLRKNDTTEISADDLTKHFVKIYSGLMFGLGEGFAFEYRGFTYRGTIKGLRVVELAAEQLRGAGGGRDDMGVLMEKSDVSFMKGEGGGLKLKSSAKKCDPPLLKLCALTKQWSRVAPNAILAPNFKFEDMGIGGLDTEFGAIFRRAFASRVFPPGLVDKLGIQHVKGILLHGPPGTGKTLMARQIGKMLNAREPKIVNGPEILNKYVGASEENIRKLFADAETEAGYLSFADGTLLTSEGYSTKPRETKVVCTSSSSMSWTLSVSSVDLPTAVPE